MFIKKIIIILAWSYSSTLFALDTDIYKASIVESEPKILLLLDTSGSMRCSGDRNQPEFNGEVCARMMMQGGEVINTGSSIIDSGLFTAAKPEARMKSVKKNTHRLH